MALSRALTMRLSTSLVKITSAPTPIAKNSGFDLETLIREVPSMSKEKEWQTIESDARFLSIPNLMSYK